MLQPTPRLLSNVEAIAALGPITLIGHSHVWCIARALQHAPPSLQVIDLWKIASPLFKDELPAIEKIRDQLKGVVVSVSGGTRFDGLAMYRHPRPFDFVSPIEPEAPLDPGAEIIPFEAVRATVLDRVGHNLDVLAKLHELTDGLFLHVESPPVWGDERRVEDWNPVFLQPTDSFGFRYLRRKVYRLHCALVREFCEARGIDIITPPPGAYDEEGFLRREFNADLVHANDAYGELMAEAVLQAIAARQRSRA